MNYLGHILTKDSHENTFEFYYCEKCKSEFWFHRTKISEKFTFGVEMGGK